MKQGTLAYALAVCMALVVLTACSASDKLEAQLEKVVPKGATVDVKDGDDGQNSYNVSIKYTAHAAPDTQKFANVVQDVQNICEAPPDAKMRIHNIHIKDIYRNRFRRLL